MNWQDENGMPNGIDSLVEIKTSNHKSEKHCTNLEQQIHNRSLSDRRDAASRPWFINNIAWGMNTETNVWKACRVGNQKKLVRKAFACPLF